MMYLGPHTGELPIESMIGTDHVDINSIVGDVVHDTLDFYELPDSIQQTVVTAIRKAAVICNRIVDDQEATIEDLRAMVKELEKPPYDRCKVAKGLGIEVPDAELIVLRPRNIEQGE